MKNIKWILLLILLCAPTIVFASTNTFTRTEEKPLVPKDVVVTSENIGRILKTPAVSAAEKIYDFADLYSDQEERDLYKAIDDYIDKTGIDLVIVTTNSLNGYDMEEYASYFYDYNDFKVEGVLFLLCADPSVSDYMLVSGDQTGIARTTYSDIITRQTIRTEHIWNHFQRGDYYEGTDNYIKIINGFYDNSHNDGELVIREDGSVVRLIPWMEIIILTVSLSFIATILCVFQITGNNKIKYKDNLTDKIDEKTLVFRTESDEYIGTSILKKK